MKDNKLIDKKSEILIATEAMEMLRELKRQELKYKELEGKLRPILLQAMQENDTMKLENEELTITRRRAHIRRTFDTKSFREDFPEMAEEYMKESNVGESVALSWK